MTDEANVPTGPGNPAETPTLQGPPASSAGLSVPPTAPKNDFDTPDDEEIPVRRREDNIISIEEVIERKRKLENANNKVKFLSKKERQKRLIEKRKKELAEKQHIAAISANSTSQTFQTSLSAPSAPSAATPTPSDSATSTTTSSGPPKKKKKKFPTKIGSFRFEWDAEDDTSAQESLLITPKPPVESNDGFRVPHKNGTKDRYEDMHWSQKPLDKMRDRDWRIFKEDYEISTRGSDLAPPLRSWSEAAIPEQIRSLIRRVGYSTPTPIQRAAVPIALTGRDVIGVAQTGSGKTASFLIPLLTYVMKLPKLDEITQVDGPYALILSPTRELAQQIESEALKFCNPLGYRCVSVIGGRTIEEQAYKLRQGAEIVIATPGRLIDLLERRALVLRQCCYVVLDEADRMISMGFEEQVTQILDELPVSNERATESLDISDTVGGTKYRQTMMYTATMPPEIESLTNAYLRNPGMVVIGELGKATDSVEQLVEFIPSEERRQKRLRDVLSLRRKFKPPIIIFVNYQKSAETLAAHLNEHGFRAVTMHGRRTQEQREKALADLRNGTADYLVATDVAGRGIDIADVSLVVNFQMARTIEDYTHRIGRTGRAGKTGTALTFLGDEDADVLYDLRQLLAKSKHSKVPEELAKHEAAQAKPKTAKRVFGDE